MNCKYWIVILRILPPPAGTSSFGCACAADWAGGAAVGEATTRGGLLGDAIGVDIGADPRAAILPLWGGVALPRGGAPLGGAPLGGAPLGAPPLGAPLVTPLGAPLWLPLGDPAIELRGGVLFAPACDCLCGDTFVGGLAKLGAIFISKKKKQ